MDRVIAYCQCVCAASRLTEAVNDDRADDVWILRRGRNGVHSRAGDSKHDMVGCPSRATIVCVKRNDRGA